MDFSRMITVGIVALIGVLYLAWPKTAFKLRTFIARKLFGMRIIPGKRTYTTYRIIGVALLVLAAIMLVRS
jgi:hypothetical protein